MRVSSIPRPCAHSSSAGNSSSFTPLRATALSLTLSPAACAASMPAKTLSSSPQRVMARERGDERHDSAPHERLSARESQLSDAAGNEGAAQPVELLE